MSIGKLKSPETKKGRERSLTGEENARYNEMNEVEREKIQSQGDINLVQNGLQLQPTVGLRDAARSVSLKKLQCLWGTWNLISYHQGRVQKYRYDVV